MSPLFLNSFATYLALVSLIGCKVARDNGFGSEINWTTLEDGLVAAKQDHRLLMLIIHKSWCGACKALKPKFAASKRIRNLSTEFIMVNVQDDEEPSDSKYSPDGKYIPRILFIDPNGDVIANIFNKNGNPSYKYYYSDAESVLESMRDALTVKVDYPVPKDDF